MVHPDTELRFINDHIGYGVVATRLIPRGTIIWVRDDLDQTFTATEVARMSGPYREILAKYTFMDARGDYVLCWDLARYMNHSCNPNCRSAGYDFELAVRDIHPGEQLTDDYGSLNLEWEFTCLCAEAVCRGRLRPDDLLRYAAVWDAIVVAPFRDIAAVPQPLWPWLKEKDEVMEVLNGREPMVSCRENYYAPPPSGAGSARGNRVA